MIELPPEWMKGDRFTSGQVANFFNVSQATVTRWAKVGLIGFIVTPAGERRFPECEVMRLANAEPVSERTREIAAYYNNVIRERWASGYRRNEHMAKRAGLSPLKAEGSDE